MCQAFAYADCLGIGEVSVTFFSIGRAARACKSTASSTEAYPTVTAFRVSEALKPCLTGRSAAF